MIHWEHWKHQQALGFFPCMGLGSILLTSFIARYRIECGDEECGFTMFDDKAGRRVVFKCDCA